MWRYIAPVLFAAAVADAAPTDNGCWQVDYGLSAKLHLSDTPMGAGDGTYAIGPGRMVLQFADSGGKPGGKTALLDYRMRDHFVVKSRALFWTTTVTTRAQTKAASAHGTLTGQILAWTTKVRGYRTDGTLTCEGSLCGKFGAPPAGTSELHIGPNDVQFRPLTFSSDLRRFTMPKTFVAKTKMPKQTAHVEVSGRELTRRRAACR